MKFNIIEKPDPTYNPDEVLIDYQNPDITVKEIKAKYGITNGKWLTLLKHWKRDGVKLRSPRNRDRVPKYYTKNRGRYYVTRMIHCRNYSFGGFATEEEAQARVKELEANNWEGLL